MHNANAMRSGERARNLDRNPQAIDNRHPARSDDVPQRVAADKFHHEGVTVIRGNNLVNRDDVRVIQRGSGTGLLKKTGTPVRPLPGSGYQDFDRHETAEMNIASLIDDTHPSFPEFFENFVMRNCSPQHGSQVKRIELAPNAREDSEKFPVDCIIYVRPSCLQVTSL